MNKRTIIPVGYRLTVTSWENDGDNYNTKIIDKLDQISVRFLVDFIRLFYSINTSSFDRCEYFGNIYEPEEGQLEKLNKIVLDIIERYTLKDVKIIMEYFVDEADNIYEDIHDSIFNLAYDLGLSEGGDFYTRVLDSFKIEYVPTEIVLADVTSEFTD